MRQKLLIFFFYLFHAQISNNRAISWVVHGTAVSNNLFVEFVIKFETIVGQKKIRREQISSMPNFFCEWRELSSSSFFLIQQHASTTSSLLSKITKGIQFPNPYNFPKRFQILLFMTMQFNVVNPLTLPSLLTKHEQLLHQEKNF